MDNTHHHVNDLSGRFDRRQLLKALGAGALAVGPLAGCGGGGSDGGEATARSFHFTAWSLNEAASKPVIEQIVSNYASAHDQHIESASYPYDEYLNQLLLQARGGQISGAAQLDIAWLSSVASLGKLVPLDAQARGAGYTEPALVTGQFEGKQYGLPWTTGSIGLVANRQLLDRAGIHERPRTVEDFVAALEELKGLGDGIVPYAASTKPEQLKDILPWMQTFGSPLVDGDRVTIGDEPSVAAVEWYKGLLDRKLIADGVARFDARALFAQGKAAFYDDAIVAKGVLAAQAKDKGLVDALEPLPRPTYHGGKSQNLLWGHIVVVFDGDGSQSAADFAKFLTSNTATVVRYFKKLALPPTTRAGLDSSAVQHDAFTRTWTELVTSAASPDPFWKYPQSAQIEEALAQQVQGVLVGKSSAREALASAREQMQELIDS